MDYHVVLYSKYELVGFDLPNLWKSFSLAQEKLKIKNANLQAFNWSVVSIYALSLIDNVISFIIKFRKLNTTSEKFIFLTCILYQSLRILSTWFQSGFWIICSQNFRRRGQKHSRVKIKLTNNQYQSVFMINKGYGPQL